MPLFTYTYASPEHGGRHVTLDCWADNAREAAADAGAHLRWVNARLRRAGVRTVRLPTAAEMRLVARAHAEAADAQ